MCIYPRYSFNYLSPVTTGDAKAKLGDTVPGFDPYVAKVLAEEPFEV